MLKDHKSGQRTACQSLRLLLIMADTGSRLGENTVASLGVEMIYGKLVLYLQHTAKLYSCS